MAEQGDVKAARIILDKVLPNATQAADDTTTMPSLVIKIENTTTRGTEHPNVRVIEHDSTEGKS